MSIPVLQSYLAGRWLGTQPAQTLRHQHRQRQPRRSRHTCQAADCSKRWTTRRVGLPALLKLDFQAARGSAAGAGQVPGASARRRLRHLRAHRRHAQRRLDRHRRRHRHALFSYAGTGAGELPSGNVLHEGPVLPRWRRAASATTHILVPRGGVAVHINAFNFPIWGLLEKFAPTFWPACPASPNRPPATSYLTEAWCGWW